METATQVGRRPSVQWARGLFAALLQNMIGLFIAVLSAAQLGGQFSG